MRAETRIMLARASEAGMRSDRDWSESGSHARYRSPRNRGCLRATVSTVGSTSDGAASLAEQAPAAIESATLRVRPEPITRRDDWFRGAAKSPALRLTRYFSISDWSRQLAAMRQLLLVVQLDDAESTS